MKTFSKEWWLELAMVIQEDRNNMFSNTRMVFPKLFDYSDDKIDEIVNYCFKRYAQAYHLEQMDEIEKNFWESDGANRGTICVIRNSGLFAGIDKEKQRILGIIDELSQMYSLNNPFDSSAIMVIKVLTKKIKGDEQ